MSIHRRTGNHAIVSRKVPEKYVINTVYGEGVSLKRCLSCDSVLPIFNFYLKANSTQQTRSTCVKCYDKHNGANPKKKARNVEFTNDIEDFL